VALANELFSGRMGPAAAQRFVGDTGARFLLSHCRSKFDLRTRLGESVAEVRRFGCAAVYRLR